LLKNKIYRNRKLKNIEHKDLQIYQIRKFANNFDRNKQSFIIRKTYDNKYVIDRLLTFFVSIVRIYTQRILFLLLYTRAQSYGKCHILCLTTYFVLTNRLSCHVSAVYATNPREAIWYLCLKLGALY